MFTRHVETTVRTEKLRDFSQTIKNEVLPLLNRQPGFIDLVQLFSDTTPGQIISMSFWKTKEDAERYEREQYNNVLTKIRPFLTTPNPQVTTFNVDTSTVHNIAAGMAA